MIRNAGAILLLLLLLTACSKEQENEPPIQVEDNPHIEVLVVFAPGQLGDRGYADDIMEGVNLLAHVPDLMGGNVLDVHFISPWSFSAIEESLARWAVNDETPYADDTYKRRLLVLTEPYMVPMLHKARSDLRPTDDILLLKVNEDDVKAAEQELDLEGRIYGLNISAAHSVRRYCRYMERLINMMQIVEDKTINHNTLYYYRLYSFDFSASRDSVYETFIDELGPSTKIKFISVSDEDGEGIFSAENNFTVIEEAYLYAGLQQTVYEMTGNAFAFIDLGSGNAGWDYWLMSRDATNETLHTLVLDASPSPLSFRIYIKRLFGFALADWCIDWSNGENGQMPRIITYTGDDLCHDNIPDPKIY